MLIITSSHGMPLDEPLVLPVPDTLAWREAEAMGMDLPMLYECIRRTPAERIAAHASALNLAVSLREAFENQNAKPRAILDATNPQ